MILLTETNSVYRSDDNGKTWAEKTNEFSEKAQSKSKKDDVGIVGQIHQSPSDKRLVFFLGDKGINWLSEDCGATIKPLNNGRKIHEFQFHPFQRNYALASIYTTCEDFDDKSQCEIYKEVYYTQDLGTHWTFLADHVLQFSWGVDDTEDTFIHQDTVLIVRSKESLKGMSNPWSY